MLKNLVERHLVVMSKTTLEFTDASGCGLSFDCNENHAPIFPSDAAKENYEDAMKHPELYPRRFNELVTRRWTYMEPATGRCHCGEVVQLVDQYYGACQCDRCGQWYNLYGDEILPPDEWEENLEEDW
jgi:hypothetical protein